MLQEVDSNALRSKSERDESLDFAVIKLIEDLIGGAVDRKKKLNLISSKAGIHVKTLHRILNKTHKPSYHTVYQLGCLCYKTQDLQKILNE